jgi:hypothetical protein
VEQIMVYQLEVKIEGEAVTPGSVRSSELATAILEFEKMVIALIQAQYPSLNLREKDVTIGLKNIVAGSTGLIFDTSHPTQTEAVMVNVETALKTGNFQMLPRKARTSLVELQSITRNYKGSLTFSAGLDGQRKELGRLNSDTEITLVGKPIESHDTLYGTVIRVGGEKPPRVLLRFPNDDTFSCRITNTNEKQIAKSLGRMLYQMVAVRGIAKRDSTDMSLVDFTIYSLGLYKETSARDALQRLGEILKPVIEEMGGSQKYLEQSRQFDEVDD